MFNTGQKVVCIVSDWGPNPNNVPEPQKDEVYTIANVRYLTAGQDGCSITGYYVKLFEFPGFNYWAEYFRPVVNDLVKTYETMIKPHEPVKEREYA